jgi:predicted metal-binding membrane protein
VNTQTIFSQFVRLKRRSWAYPEWWSLSLCVAAWLVFLVPLGIGTANVHAAHNHTVHSLPVSASLPTQTNWLIQGGWWMAMVVAMMFPMVINPVRITAACSLWHRRHHAVCIFLLGYIGPWLVFGLAASLMVFAVQRLAWLRLSTAAALAFAIALLWQFTRAKRKSLLACHRTRPLAPNGWRADRDCLRYGWMIGGWCLVSCWPLMLACAFAGHGISAMVAVTGLGWVERNQPRPNQFLLAAVITTLGLAQALSGLI